jgi:hypothetical protein
MGKSKPLTIQCNVTKIVTLYENGTLELEETQELLKQFNKDDLIECLLGVELEDEETLEEERFDKNQVKSKTILKKKDRVKETEKDLDFDDDDDDGDLDL